MKSGFSRRALALGIAAALGTGMAAAQGGGWQPSASITPVYQGKGALDGGGDYSAWSVLVRAGVSSDFAGGHRAGVSFTYDYTDYAFSAPKAFGGVAPWGAVRRYGASAPLAFNAGGGWFVAVVPSVDWIHENDADEGEALNWGAILSATRFFPDGSRIGVGVGVYQRIEKTSVFPLILVDWKLADRWRLVNPLTAGPTGPAGLELDYRFDGGWNLGLGAAMRSTRFRLSETGPVPDGIGEERGVPVFLRATRSFGPHTALSLYAGMTFAGQLRVEDSAGNLRREADFDPAPLLALTFSARF
jgi:hypothetical protein